MSTQYNTNANSQRTVTIPQVKDQNGNVIPLSNQNVVHIIKSKPSTPNTTIKPIKPSTPNIISNSSTTIKPITSNKSNNQSTGSKPNISETKSKKYELIIRNNNGKTTKIVPDSQGNIQINQSDINSGKLYITIDETTGQIILNSVDGGSIVLRRNSKGQVKMSEQNGMITFPISEVSPNLNPKDRIFQFNTEDLMDMFNSDLGISSKDKWNW